MSYDFLFVCVCVFLCMNLQTDIHKHIHMPRGTTMQSLTNPAVVFVMRKLKFPEPEDKQTS